MDTHTGNAPSAEKNTRVVKHKAEEHKFCVKCGMCDECGDCAIWGCGRLDPYGETDD